MSYNIFTNVISSTSTIDNNIKNMINESILPIQEKLNYIFSNDCFIDVTISGIEGRYIQSNHKKSIINNYFVDSTFNLYILNNKIIIKKSDGWYFVEFNTTLELIINLNINLDAYVENEIFITNETKYFNNSSYPRNISITYI